MIRADDLHSIIEPYFDGGDSYIGHHKFSYIMQYEVCGDIELSQNWDSGSIKVFDKGSGSLHRSIYKNNISEFDTVTLKMSCPENVQVKLYFDDMLVLDVTGTGKLDLYESPIKMNSVQKIKYVIANSAETDNIIGLYYVGVSKKQAVKLPRYEGEWEGCIEENISFEPYNDDVLTRQLADKILGMLNEEPYKSIYENEKNTALLAMKNEPEQHISKMISECFRGKMNFCVEIEALAFVGIVEKNADMIRMACRYALSMSACEYWGCDIMEEIPTCVWHHRSFNESSACGCMAFVISLCGNSFTWHGRNVLYQSIIMKGLPRLEADFMTMDYIYKMNQGIAFMCGYIKALICLCHEYPRYERRLAEAEELFCEMLEKAQNPDGSTNEGAGYWQYTFWSAIRCIVPIAKKKNLSLYDYIGEKFRKTSDFGLFLIDKTARMLPYNDSGRGYYIPYMSKCFYLLTGDERWAFSYHSSDIKNLGIDNILLDVDIPKTHPVMIKEFEAFDDAGLVSVCRDDIRIVCVSGESNATHCHADKGSFMLYLGEKCVLIDRVGSGYDKAGANFIHDTEFHNTAVPIIKGKALSQKTGDGVRADFKYEYKNGVFRWESDQTALWDSSLVKKNIRTIYSEKPSEFIITDEFEFTEPTSVSVNFHQQESDLINIEPLSEYLDIKHTIDVNNNVNVDRMSYITKKGLTVEFISKICVKQSDE